MKRGCIYDRTGCRRGIAALRTVQVAPTSKIASPEYSRCAAADHIHRFHYRLHGTHYRGLTVVRGISTLMGRNERRVTASSEQCHRTHIEATGNISTPDVAPVPDGFAVLCWTSDASAGITCATYIWLWVTIWTA